MADIVVSRDTYDKFNKNGRLRLSAGYIQEAFEKNGYPGYAGILQVLKHKDERSPPGSACPFCYRFRLSDGVFNYNVLIDVPLEAQIRRDEIREGAIIAITSLDILEICLGSKTEQDKGAKPAFLIKNYQLLSRYHSILAAPDVKSSSHSGKKDEHYGYRPSFVIEDEWPEASEFTREHQENHSGPPAAKKTKANTGLSTTGRLAPPPVSRNSSSNGGGDAVIPISAITPYISKFKIHGTCTRKEDIRQIPAKNMKVFNFELTDDKGDTIRICAFNELAESMLALVNENMTYYVTGGTIRAANKRFNGTGHDYEITLRSDSKVELGGEIMGAPKVTAKCIKLGQIAAHVGEVIDVMGIVDQMDMEANTFTSKQGKELIKREIIITDDSNTTARVTLWGEEAKAHNAEDFINQVVVFKSVIPREWNGTFSLSTGGSTRILRTPDMDGVEQLYAWHTGERDNAEIKSISQGGAAGGGAFGRDLKCISSIKALRFGNDKNDYLNVKAMITRINPQNAIYKACAKEGCQKKVVEIDGVEYRCEKCQLTTSNFKWWYMMTVEITDFSGQVYATAFGETAQKITGYDAQELGSIKEGNPTEFNEIFERLNFETKMFRVRCKFETYNEETRQKVNIYEVSDVDKEKYTEELRKAVDAMEQLEVEAAHQY